METSPTTLVGPPSPPQPPPSFFAPPPFSKPDNTTTNSSIIMPPPPLPFSTSSPQIYPGNPNGTAVTIVTINPSQPFPDSPSSVDLSPLEFILAILAVITIPAIIYASFFAVKCPPWASRERHDRELPRSNSGSSSRVEVIEEKRDSVSGVKYQKETHSKDIGIECPVCLSAFADGEDVKRLSGCNHSFHATCIDLWLNNHNNCPICRAAVVVKRPKSNGAAASSGTSTRDSDFHQGMPDAASLV